MISDILTYDNFPKKSSNYLCLILSFDPEFKQKIINTVLPSSAITVGFKEDNPDVFTVNFMDYFNFFMKILPEVHKVIIDTKIYSHGISIIHSSALNSKNVKEVILYVEDDTEDFSFIENEYSGSAKERTYSRQELLNS